MEINLVSIRVRHGSDVYDLHVLRGRSIELYGFNPARGSFDVLMNHLLKDEPFMESVWAALRGAGINRWVLFTTLGVPQV